MLNARVARFRFRTLAGLIASSGLMVDCTPGTAPPVVIATRLGFALAPPATAQSGVILSPAPVIQLLDPQGDPVATSGRNVTAVLSAAGGNLLGTVLVKTDASGKATFANLAISALAGAWRIRFDSPGLSSVTSDAIQVGVGPLALLTAAVGNLQTAVAGTAVATAPVVLVSDGAGNPVAGVPVGFVANNGGSVEGASATSNAAGLAGPTRWTLGTTLGINTLVATSSALPGASVAFTATGSVGPPALLTVVAGDGQTATVGGNTAVAPAALLTDAFGHPLPSVAVLFTVSGGGGSVTSGNPLTNAAGVATLGSWAVGLLPGPNSLTVSRAGVPSVMLHATGVDFPVAVLGVGNGHSCAVDPVGAAFCWGNNATGQVGNGAAANVMVPTAVSGGLTFASVAAGTGHSCGLLQSGEAYCWGVNDAGQVGDGTVIPRSTPVPVTGGVQFSAIVLSGGFTCGLRVGDGAAFCWGFGGNGQLGNGTNTNRPVPTAVTGGHLFSALSTGGSHTCGLKTDGTVFCWGFNGNGRLGDGTTTNRLVPTAVTGGFTFMALSAGGSHTCGIVTGGAGYCWGSGAGGRLGNGAVTDQLVPFAVSGTLVLSAVSAHLTHSCALAAGGAAHCWGGNASGQLGDGTNTTRMAPTAVVGGLSYSAIAAGGDHTCARSSGGGAYCWGRNDLGMVGDGTGLARNRPVGAVRP